MTLKILVSSGTIKRTVELEGATSYSVGRSETALQIEDVRCSKTHALLYQAPDGTLHLRDLNSSNGTLLRGTKIKDAPIYVGDEIKIGATTLTFLEIKGTSEAPKAPEPRAGSGGIDEVLHGWPNNLRSLPEEKLKEFIDHTDEEMQKKSVRLQDLVKKKNAK